MATADPATTARRLRFLHEDAFYRKDWTLRSTAGWAAMIAEARAADLQPGEPWYTTLDSVPAQHRAAVAQLLSEVDQLSGDVAAWRQWKRDRGVGPTTTADARWLRFLNPRQVRRAGEGMAEPANHTALVDASSDTWVRVDEHPGRYGRWWPITDGPGWEEWARHKVGVARDWDDLAEYGPFTEADPQRAGAALAQVRAERALDAPGGQAVPAAAPPGNHTTSSRESIVNLEATGPEEIRAAFTAATETAQQSAEEMAGIAGTLTEAADRYESLQMAPSTVGHIREAGEAFANAQNALNTATEELEAALADFNAHDGAVADTVADTGGNVADREVLVG